MSRVLPFPLLWLSTATKNCLKDAVWTVLYQNQRFSGYFELQNTVLKMSLVIFEPEGRSMNIYGYCRISTAKQSIERQIRNIKAEYPTAHIVQEAYTGTSIFRPEWLKLYVVPPLNAQYEVVQPDLHSLERYDFSKEPDLPWYP